MIKMTSNYSLRTLEVPGTEEVGAETVRHYSPESGHLDMDGHPCRPSDVRSSSAGTTAGADIEIGWSGASWISQRRFLRITDAEAFVAWLAQMGEEGSWWLHIRGDGPGMDEHRRIRDAHLAECTALRKAHEAFKEAVRKEAGTRFREMEQPASYTNEWWDMLHAIQDNVREEFLTLPDADLARLLGPEKCVRLFRASHKR